MFDVLPYVSTKLFRPQEVKMTSKLQQDTESLGKKLRGHFHQNAVLEVLRFGIRPSIKLVRQGCGIQMISYSQSLENHSQVPPRHPVMTCPCWAFKRCRTPQPASSATALGWMWRKDATGTCRGRCQGAQQRKVWAPVYVYKMVS